MCHSSYSRIYVCPVPKASYNAVTTFKTTAGTCENEYIKYYPHIKKLLLSRSATCKLDVSWSYCREWQTRGREVVNEQPTRIRRGGLWKNRPEGTGQYAGQLLELAGSVREKYEIHVQFQGKGSVGFNEQVIDTDLALPRQLIPVECVKWASPDHSSIHSSVTQPKRALTRITRCGSTTVKTTFGQKPCLQLWKVTKERKSTYLPWVFLNRLSRVTGLSWFQYIKELEWSSGKVGMLNKDCTQMGKSSEQGKKEDPNSLFRRISVQSYDVDIDVSVFVLSLTQTALSE